MAIATSGPDLQKTPMSSAANVAGAGSNPMESFAALFEESLLRKEMRTGEVITAEVVRIDMNFRSEEHTSELQSH